MSTHVAETPTGTPMGWGVMAHRVRSMKLQTRGARLRLPVAKKPVFVKIAPGLSLGYRRNQTTGTWVVRVADGNGANWTKAIGAADDFEETAGTLDFWQAQDRARAVARAGQPSGAETVAKAQHPGRALVLCRATRP